MAKTFEDIQKQIEALQQEAAMLRDKEVSEVVIRIKVAIAHYGLTASDLGFGKKASAGSRGKSGKLASNGTYSDGAGNSWSGRGRRPGWLVSALSQGRKLSDFAVHASAAASSKQAKPTKEFGTGSAKSSGGGAPKYADGSGHAWTGRGPRPAWLKEAIAQGKQLEEFLTESASKA